MINTHHIAGRLKKDPDVRVVNDSQVANFLVETWSIWEGRAYFTSHRVSAWGKLADAASRLGKGDMVSVTGRAGSRSYEREGETRWVHEIRATEVTPLDAEPPPREQYQGLKQQQQRLKQQHQSRRQQQQRYEQQQPQQPDDDVPF